MADGYYFCIEPPRGTTNPRHSGEHDERRILHVKFHGTERKDYEARYENLESTPLTEFLKEKDVDNYHEMLLKLTFNITPLREANAFCKSVLERGMFCRQGPYHFLGHSETQLKEKSCFLMKASHEDIHQLLAQFGDFLAERNVGKRARQISMLFSPLNKTQPLDVAQYLIKPDIKRRGILRSYTFTDGCGFMSPEFSNEVQETLKIDYKPSVVQVRYRGIEGLLVLKEDLTDVKVQFHESMEKLKSPDENMPESLSFVDVVDYSRPYETGYLDTRMIMLLADRGVPVDNLMELQLRYYELLDDICNEAAPLFLTLKGKFDLVREIQERGIQDAQIQKSLKSLRDQELHNMKNADGQTRILVPNSRVVFAVCDPYSRLNDGECYFSPTMSEDEEKSFAGVKKVVVIRKYCHHPRDVQVLKLKVMKEGYKGLRDCLVLPTNGPRPYVLDFAGTTSDANTFFVSWSKNILPKVAVRPFGYPPKKAAPGIRKSLANVTSMITRLTSRNSSRQRNAEGRNEMLQYFASFTDDLTERIEEVYTECAAVLGPSSKECRKLSKMFYQAINLIEDRAVLIKELSELKQKLRTTSLYEAMRQRALRFLKCHSRRPYNPGNQVQREIERRAEDFVARA